MSYQCIEPNCTHTSKKLGQCPIHGMPLYEREDDKNQVIFLAHETTLAEQDQEQSSAITLSVNNDLSLEQNDAVVDSDAEINQRELVTEQLQPAPSESSETVISDLLSDPVADAGQESVTIDSAELTTQVSEQKPKNPPDLLAASIADAYRAQQDTLTAVTLNASVWKQPDYGQTPENSAFDASTAENPVTSNHDASAQTAFVPSHEEQESPVLQRKLVGERQLKELIEEGYEIFLIAGIGGVGKTEIIESYRHMEQKASLNYHDPDKPAEPTAPGTLKTHFIDIHSRSPKAVIVDAAGEEFSMLYPPQDREWNLSPARLQALEFLAPHLAGVIITLELEKIWNPTRDQDKAQEKIASWTLGILRWLRAGGKYPEHSELSLQDYITKDIMHLPKSKRLNIPVLALYNKADLLHGLSIGQTNRALFPLYEQPYFFTRHALPVMHEALMMHCRYFHTDFIHAFPFESSTGKQHRDNALGLSVFNWLFHARWQKARKNISTKRLLQLQYLADLFAVFKRSERRSRWVRLPDAKQEIR